MTVAETIANALRPLAPGGKLSAEDVPLIDTLASQWASRSGGARRINEAGLRIVKDSEGLVLKAYICPAGVLTIGYGSTGAHVKPGMVITEAYAEELLREDLARFEAAVAKAAPGANDNQFSAMVSLAFNIGIAAFQKSTVLRKHLAGEHVTAAEAFKLWNKGGGRVLPGLVKRRAAEAQLYRMAA